MPTAFTLAKLVTELNNDPKSLGLPDDVNNVLGPQIAVIRNKLNATTGDGAESVPSLPIQSSAFLDLIQFSELDGLTSLQIEQLRLRATAQLVSIGNPDTQSWLAAVFANCPDSKAAMEAAGSRIGSRAEVLWGTGFSVSDNQVSDACDIILA